MRYSIIHPVGVKPPSNALAAGAYHHLERATQGGAQFTVKEGDRKPFPVRVSKHTEQVLRTLIKRPLYCGSRCRLSQYVSALRDLGVGIDTEGYRADVETGRDTYGVYFLRSTVTEVKP